MATIETTDTAGFEAATAAAVDSRALERLDEATVTSLLEFRFQYLVNAGFGCTKAAVLAARTDVPLCELTELFTAPLGAVH